MPGWRASRAAKEVCDEGRGVGPGGRGVYLDFADAIKRLGRNTIEERYGSVGTYSALLQKAINNLVEAGFLLPFDAERALTRNVNNVVKNNLLPKN